MACEFGAYGPFPQPMKFYSILAVMVTTAPKSKVQDRLTTIDDVYKNDQSTVVDCCPYYVVNLTTPHI
jgi:hypothetical protein